MRQIIIYFILLVFIVSGCTITGELPQAQLETPEQYRFSDHQTDSLLNLEWWNLVQDDELKELIILGLQQNKDVRIAASRIEQARAALGYAKADQFPSLDVSAGASRGNFSGTSALPATASNFYIAPSLSYEIDFWGKYRSASKAARAEMLGTEMGLRIVQMDLIAGLSSAYLDLLNYHQSLRIAIRTSKSRKESLNIISERFNEGVIPEIDLNQAQIQAFEADASIPMYERLIAQAENAINLLLGRPSGEIAVTENLLDQLFAPNIPAGIPSQLLQRRPDVLQAAYAVDAQFAQVGVAQAARLPSLSLTASGGYASGEIDNLFSGDPLWSISGNILAPLFHFSKLKNNLEMERELAKQAVFDYEYVALNAFKEVEDALISIQTYKMELEAREQQLKAARNAAKLSYERYNGGVTDYLEVQESERSLFSIELQVVQTKKDYIDAYVQLYKALGGGWLNEAEKSAAESPDGE